MRHGPKTARNQGTCLGPNLLAFLTSAWGKAVSAGNAISLPNDALGTGTRDCHKAHAGGRLGQAAKDGRPDARVPLKVTVRQDGRDSRHPVWWKRQYAWACVGYIDVIVKAGTRGTTRIDCHFPHHDKPIACDRYSACDVFRTRQYCRAHVLREEAEFIRHAKASPAAAMLLLHRSL